MHYYRRWRGGAVGGARPKTETFDARRRALDGQPRAEQEARRKAWKLAELVKTCTKGGEDLKVLRGPARIGKVLVYDLRKHTVEVSEKLIEDLDARGWIRRVRKMKRSGIERWTLTDEGQAAVRKARKLAKG